MSLSPNTYADLWGGEAPAMTARKLTELPVRNAYGLPHATLRPGQAETIDYILARPTPSVTVLDAPTGSGKTSFAAAARTQGEVISLVKTKNLQIENYGGAYKFDVLYGRGNYACVHPDADGNITADHCMYGSAMRECEVADACPYLIKKDLAAASDRASLNYPYWLTARWPRQKLRNSSGFLFLDEAHQLSDVVLDFVSITVTMRQRLDYDLPAFPLVRGRPNADDAQACLAWLSAAGGVMATHCAQLKKIVGVRDEDSDIDAEDAPATGADASALKQLKAATQLKMQLGRAYSSLAENATDWYLRSGPGARIVGDAPQPAFVARPLTARYHFPHLFTGDWRTVLMSATIGNIEALAEELGLTTYDYRSVPNQFAPATRPVYALPAPAMGQKTKNDATAQLEHARVIADAIKACPSHWSGLILTTSKSEAKNLSHRLCDLGLEKRIYTPNPTLSTEQQVDWWNRMRRRHLGALCVTWNFWEGYNGLEEKIVVVSKTPFASLGDEYERERMLYSGAFYLQRAAWQMEQGLGRTRRGRAEDYDSDGERRGLVAIADANYTRVRKYFSQSLRDAVVEDTP